MQRLARAAVMLLFAHEALTAAELGMEAPPLKIGKWVKGGPVDLAAGRGTNVYVVEFWATWCGPCRQTIPHLSELQKRFKDRGLIVVGVSDEQPERVRPFVERMGNKMDYTVATDDTDKTGDGYMRAFEVGGIPHAFVVDKQGRIAWQGHPLEGLDVVVEDILEDRYDVEVTKDVQSYFAKSMEGGDPDGAREIGERIAAKGVKNPRLLDQFAWIILTHPRIKHRDIGLATRAARLAYEKTQGKDVSIVDTYARAFFVAGKIPEAIDMQKQAVAEATSPEQREQLEKTLKHYQTQPN